MTRLAHLAIGPGRTWWVLAIVILSAARVLSGQTTNAVPGESGKSDEPLNWTTQQDHRNMMEQLGIAKLRPGPSGNPSAPNAANFDPKKANSKVTKSA